MKRAQRRTDSLTIMAYDPSLTGWGWVILKVDGTVVACGCIKTEPQNKVRRIRKGDDDIRRISEINNILLRRIRHHKVSYFLSELPHGSQSSSAAKMIGITSAVAQTQAQVLDIPIEWYSEGDAKKALLGKISATKAETIEAIDNQYAVPWMAHKYQNEAVADAMAIFHVALEQSSFLKFYKNQNK